MTLHRKILYALRHPSYLRRRLLGPIVESIQRKTKYDHTQWSRVVMYRQLFERIRELGPGKLSALEIAPGGSNSPWRQLGFAEYVGVDYPQFDICKDRLDREFDIIVADQVFEHLLWPYRAARNVFSMLKTGGRFVSTTPFLIRVHDVPVDCSRWTETGIKHLLAETGFDMEKMITGSWGNAACVRANLPSPQWASIGWGRSLRNEPEYPVVVWVVAGK